MQKGKNMAKKATATKTTIPGTIYLNKNRYWWKVQLPGEPAAKAQPLKPIGARFATAGFVACEVAGNLWQQVVYQRLMTVEGLKYGWSAARENPKRKPVDERHVYVILPYTTPVVAKKITQKKITGFSPTTNLY